MTDRYEKIRKALADMDAAAEARNALAWREAQLRLVVHAVSYTSGFRELLAERDQLAAALEAEREEVVALEDEVEAEREEVVALQAERDALARENEAMRRCAIKYLEWLGVTHTPLDQALYDDMHNPSMCGDAAMRKEGRGDE